MCSIALFVVYMRPRFMFPILLCFYPETQEVIDSPQELESTLRECAEAADLPYLPPLLTEEAELLAHRAPLRFIKRYLNEVHRAKQEGGNFVHF